MDRPWRSGCRGGQCGAEGFIAISLQGQFTGGGSYAAVLPHTADRAPLFNDFKAVKRSLIAGNPNLNAQWSGSDAWFNELERSALRTLGTCPAIVLGAGHCRLGGEQTSTAQSDPV